MKNNARTSVVLAAGAVLAASPWATQSHAAGFQLRELSSQGVGSAFSGSAAKATDLSTIFMNPAGMMLLEGSRAQADLMAIMPSIHFKGSAGIGPVTYSGGNGGDAGEDSIVPAAYGLIDLGPRLKAGIAVNVPFGLATKYDDGWKGRYFAIESEIQNLVITPSIAWQATDRLSFGAGIQIGHAEATLSQALNLSPLALPDGLSTLKGDGYGYGYTLGVLYQIDEGTRVGLSYRSKIKYTLKGRARISDVPAGIGGLVPALNSSDAEADVTTPDILSLGFYHEINPQWAVMSDVSWTNWSTFDELRVKFDDGRADSVTKEDWHDSWFVAVGADYKPREKHTVHFGLAYDQSPVPDKHRTARIPDGDRYWASLGYSYEFRPDSSVNVGYTHIFFEETSIKETTASGTLQGRYEGSADVFSISMNYRF